MSDTVIKVENLSKQYRLGLVGTGTLTHDLNRWWHQVRGKEDPYLKIGETNDRATKATSDYVWALKDINFEVKQGEVLGIIGKNGAGKSTLLKLLSRVTTPTVGEIKAKGRIASLLEVGTGFHPELTGRDNIFLNGAILGMTKAEIKHKLDEIIDFSGTARYIDTPVKRYSSGMRVRLAFAVAAYLEPEILIVDEVLAVGDAEFQKKAVGKMKDVAQGGGRTVLFVSHNMAAVKSLCSRGIVLKNGEIHEEGSIDEVVSNYLKGENDLSNFRKFVNKELATDAILVKEISVSAKNKSIDEPMTIDDELVLKVGCHKMYNNDRYDITVLVKDDEGNCIFTTSSGPLEQSMEGTGMYEVRCRFPANFFNIGTFNIDLLCVKNFKAAPIIERDILSFTLIGSNIQLGRWMGISKGPMKPKLDWQVNPIL